MQYAREIKVGLTVLFALALLYLSIAWTQRLHFFAPDEYGYTIHFDNVNGLLEGDPVTIRGYTAGRVIQILPTSTYVAVELSLDRNIPLYQDARVDIQLKELMGGKQIAISPGIQEPVLEDGAILIGSISPDFSSSFSQFGEVSAQINLLQLQRILHRIDTFSAFMMAVAREIQPTRLDRMLQHAEQISHDVSSMTRDIRSRQLIERLDQSLTQVDSLLGSGEYLITQSSNTIHRLDTMLLPKAHTLIQESERALGSVQSSLSQLERLLSQLESQENLAGRAIFDPALSQKVDSVIYHLNKTLEQIHSQKVIVGFKRKK
ncbi:MAG: MlaD family protein [Bacteroidota bacterium]